MSGIVRLLFVAMIFAVIMAGGATLNRSANSFSLSGVPAAFAQDQTNPSQGSEPSQPANPSQTDEHRSTTDVNVTETTTHQTSWYTNPVWIVVGALIVGVVIALIVMASKGGGGTTVVGR